MTKADVLAALAAKPVPFTVDGVDVLLRPVRYGDRSALVAWIEERKKDGDGWGFELQKKVCALAVCDAAGNLLLSEADVDTLDPNAVTAIAKEAARRSGMDPKEDAPGKAKPAKTPN